MRAFRPRDRFKLQLAFVLLVLAGCNRTPPTGAKQAGTETATVQVTTPQVRTLVRRVSLPGSIQAFERTPIYAKVPGYVLKWSVDIGAKVKTKAPLAELWVPELRSQLQFKKEQVEQAKKAKTLADAQVGTARALIKEAEASQAGAKAIHDFWLGQSDSFAKLVAQNTLDKQTLADAENKLAQAKAALGEAAARIDSARAMLQEKDAVLARADADIVTAQAEQKYQQDLVDYATFLAPYDGVITRRNVNTFDFVQPPTAGKGEPLYVIERRDLMRICVEVPETDAVWVAKGDEARVRVLALPGKEFTDKVARTSYALDPSPRTLLVEIDLTNDNDLLRPGMYVLAVIEGTRPDVLTLPVTAVVTEGDVNVGWKSFCFIAQDDKVRRTQIEIGGRDDRFVEVLAKLVPGKAGEPPQRQPFVNGEEVVERNVAALKDGQTVIVERAQK